MPSRRASLLIWALVIATASCLAQDGGSRRERFVVLGTCGNQASAWEYVTAPPRLVKRFDFPGCAFTPRPLLSGLPLRFLRFRAVDDDRWIRTKHVMMDYDRWTVTPIDVDADLRGVLGRVGDGYYLWRRGEGPYVRLDAKSGEIAAVDWSFWRRFDLGTAWIVRSDGDIVLFDTTTGRPSKSKRVPEPFRGVSWVRASHPAVSPDGRYAAWLSGVDWSAIHALPPERRPVPIFTDRLPSSVLIHDFERGTSHEVALGFFGVAMSGRWNAKPCVDLRFVDTNRLTFLSVAEGATWEGGIRGSLRRGEVERVMVNLPAGTVERRLAAAADAPAPIRRGPSTDRTYRYLAGCDRALRFLKAKGVVPEEANGGIRACAWSSDETRFLAFVKRIGFVHGDVDAGAATRVEAEGIEYPRILVP